MRNFSLFVEVKTDGKIISKYNKIQGIHQPTPYLDGYLAADRNCGEESIIVLAADGTQKKLFTGDFLLVRGIERLGGDHFLITSATTVSEISLDGKIHYKAHVKGVSSTAEIGITNTRKLSNIGSCGPKTLYQAVPTALKKQERWFSRQRQNKRNDKCCEYLFHPIRIGMNDVESLDSGWDGIVWMFDVSAYG